MTNRFGFDLYPKEVRWAAAEGVSEDVIAAVLLLHDRSVDEITPQLSATELDQVITLVGRSPRLYPRGILEALERRRGLTTSPPPPQSAQPNPTAKDEATPSASACHPPRSDAQPSSRTGPDGQQSPTERGKRVERPWMNPEPKTTPGAAKAGTAAGTRDEPARRRLIVEDLARAGLSIRMIADVTDIPRSSVHRALWAGARAEAKKQAAIADLVATLLGKKLSHRRRERA
jgi:hypothetical protein